MTTDSTQTTFINEAMTNVMQRKATSPFKAYFHDSCVTVDHATVSYCLYALAHLINDGDDIYLPIFERIKTELDRLEHNTELKDLAMNLVAQSSQNSLSHFESLH